MTTGTRKPKLGARELACIEAEFADLAEASLRELGASVAPRSSVTEWLLDTRAGKMRVFIFGNWLACQFDDPERAVKVLGDGTGQGNYVGGGPVGVNRFSGKWNWMFGPWSGFPGECGQAVEAFRESVERDLVSHAE